MEKTHDTLVDLHAGTPLWFTALAWLLPAGLLGQFLTAGLGLFLDPALIGAHAAIGTALSLPLVALLAGSLLVRRLRGFAWWTGLATVLYSIQVALAAGGSAVPLSLHPANGALLLCASLVLAAKVERRRARPSTA